MESGSPRERLYEVFADADRSLSEKVDEALDVGTEYLGLSIGFFTRIEDETQEIVRATGDHDMIRPGETCPLEEAYCRRTIELDETLAIQDVHVSSIDRRAVDTFGLEAYIGAKVLVDDDVYGTVCFASLERRDGAFSEAEEIFVELLAKLVGTALERREYEHELHERNERLRREKRRFEGIAETSFDIIFRLSRDAQFTYVSSAVERILGYPPEELTDEFIFEFMTDPAAVEAAEAYTRVLGGEHVESLELDFVDDAGDVVVLEVNGTPIRDDGDVVGVQGVGRDITARKEREHELRVKTRAMDEARVGITIADMTRPDEPLIYVNEGFERLTGYDADEVLEENCRFLQGEATDPDAVVQLRRAIDAEASVSVELVNYRKDGTPFWNQVKLSPIYHEDGELAHYLGFQSDVTERRRTDQLIRLLNRVLRHNLRNDMMALMGWTRAIRTGERTVEDVGERLEDVPRKLVELSEHAREVERYAGRDRDVRRLDPADLVDDAVADASEQYPEATIDVTISAENDVCAGVELERAVSELLENGAKHNPAPEPRVEVTAEDDEAGEWVELTVVDDGPGIDEMEAEVVATGNETPLRHGSGLGLWLVNWIVTRYGGSFQIAAREGDDGSGTVASLSLPAIGDDTPIEAAERGPTVLFR